VGGALMKPGWPLALLFVGYPLWWVLGVIPVVAFVACVAMAYHLLHRRTITTPRGFGLWLLFLVWVFVGVAVLQVDAPGAVAGANSGRYLVWAYRLTWYLGATITLLYIGNVRKEVSTERVSRILATMFIWVVAGGLLGTVYPTLDFPSVAEHLLPHNLATNGFVLAQIHPTVAQWGDVLGHSSGRPSAPFTYANIWGLNFACFLPFFVAAWLRAGAGWRRPVGSLLLAISVIPVIYSLNRGLWIALLTMAVFVSVRSAAAGRVRLLGGLLASVVILSVSIALSPLAGTLEARFSNPSSNEGRANLTTLAIESAAQKSPVIGFGTTRNVQGSFASISRGDTAKCPRCSPPALGTQGQLSLVTFSQGIVGLLLYLGFFGMQFLRHIRLRTQAATTGLAVVLVAVVTTPVYNTVGVALFPLMAAVALLWRESLEQTSSDGHSAASVMRAGPTHSLGGYVLLLRRHLAVLICAVLIGSAFGGVWQWWHGVPTKATISVVLPSEPVLPGSLVGPLTLDTQGQLVSAQEVRKAVEAVTGDPGGETPMVTAEPNSRVLNLSVEDRSPDVAERAVTAAADAVLDLREKRLDDRKRNSLEALHARADGTSAAVATLNTAMGVVEQGQPRASHQPMYLLRAQHYLLLVELGKVNSDVERVSSLRPSPGHILMPSTTHRLEGGWNVSLVSGAVLGLLAGLVVALRLDSAGQRLGRVKSLERATGIHRIVVPFQPLNGSLERRATALARQLPGYRADAFVSADSTWEACGLAAHLDLAARPAAGSTVPHCPRRVILTASGRTRTRDVSLLRDRLELAGSEVVGLVIADGEHPKRRYVTKQPLRGNSSIYA
jgi:hypothetical protein